MSYSNSKKTHYFSENEIQEMHFLNLREMFQKLIVQPSDKITLFDYLTKKAFINTGISTKSTAYHQIYYLSTPEQFSQATKWPRQIFSLINQCQRKVLKNLLPREKNGELVQPSPEQVTQANYVLENYLKPVYQQLAESPELLQAFFESMLKHSFLPMDAELKNIATYDLPLSTFQYINEKGVKCTNTLPATLFLIYKTNNLNPQSNEFSETVNVFRKEYEEFLNTFNQPLYEGDYQPN